MKLLFISQTKTKYNLIEGEDRLFDTMSCSKYKGYKIYSAFKDLYDDPEMYLHVQAIEKNHTGKDNIQFVNREFVMDSKFDFVYIHRNFPGVRLYNQLRLNSDCTFLFLESYKDIEKNNGMGEIKKAINNNLQIIGHCSRISFDVNKFKGVKNLFTPNVCNGKLIDSVTERRDKKVVFIGRFTSNIADKIFFLAKNYPSVEFHIFGTKYQFRRKNKEYRFGMGSIICDDTFLEKKRTIENVVGLKNFVVRKPHYHDVLYEKLSRENFSFGLVPSIHTFSVTAPQYNSSAKFFDYIASGIPVLSEDIVSESFFVNQSKFIGLVYKNNKRRLLNKFNKMLFNEYSKTKILKYAIRNHRPAARAKAIIESM